MFKNALNVGIVSNDSGGAQNLSHFIRNNPKQYWYSVTGPASGIFLENIGLGVNESKSLDEIIANCDLLILSTGWSTLTELNALAIAKKQGIFAIAILDHWVNYEMRFNLHENLVLPDAIWVVDEHALKIATEEFPSVEIIQVPNYYLKSELQKIHEIENLSQKLSHVRLLFLGESISENAHKNFGDELYFGFNEKSSFEFLLKYLYRDAHLGSTLRIRLHPHENDASKYIRILNRVNAQFLRVEISAGTLSEDISWCTSAYGVSSFALYLAACAGKPAFSCIPNSSIDLPFPPSSVKRIY
jgi:hypothetical protein